jgi:hypothetical protein
MGNLPIYIPAIFIATTLLTLLLFYDAVNRSKNILLLSIMWLTVQATIGISGFYTVTDTTPPRLFFVLAPVLLSVIMLTSSKKGKSIIDRMPTDKLILISIVRVPVEFVLLWLYQAEQIPQIMTFEGYNYDILSGISTPVIWWLQRSGKLSKLALQAWNIICLGLLVNIVSIAVLSAPSPFQQLAFNQPNIAVLSFPYVWLPSFIVPIVIISHISILRKKL